MRLVSALLFVALTGTVTLADEAKPADPKPEVSRSKVPLRVVRMLPETHQVLLFHKNKGTHVVAEVGQDVDGYIIDEIDGDEVTLVAPSGAEVILTAPDTTWRRRQAERKAADAKKAAASGTPKTVEAMPEDPYADPTTPADPYADAAGAAAGASSAAGATTEPGGSASATGAPVGEVRVASANGATAPSATATGPTAIVPADPYADPDAGITAFAEAVGATAVRVTPARPAPSKNEDTDAAGVLAAAATGSPAPTTSAAPAANGKTFTVARSEVDAALADFGATAVTFDARFVADGLRIDAIAAGTLLEKAGLKKGDVITAVDGKPLRSFDDAADVYARMQTARSSTVVVQRAGKPVTLKVAIR
jgi:membrane-associated protease RseP (regulator of RpoE activity)